MASANRQPGHHAPGRPRRGERTLARDQIIDEALALVDAEGADALTMRKLAQRLGVEAMSLYGHVANKNDLLDAVADRVASELALPSVLAADWRQRIRNAVTAWAQMQARHPGGFPLLYRGRRGTANESAVTEEIMDALVTAGFDSGEVALIYQTLVAFLDGALLNWPLGTWGAAAAWQQIALQIDAVRYPRTAESAAHASQLGWTDVFYTGLDLFLAGLEDRLTRRDRLTD